MMFSTVLVTARKIKKLPVVVVLALLASLISAFSAAAAENYIVLQGFGFDINSEGEAVIHNYDDRSADVVIPHRLMGADVKRIDDYAFFGDEAINSVSFSNAVNLKTIGVNAFFGCTGLKSLELPSWIEALSFGSFQNCSSLESISIGEGIPLIPAQCFYQCSELKQVSIPETVTEIGDRAFAGCSKLSIAVIPDTVEKIAENAFDGCDNLVIYCTKDSRARQYAAENKISYVVTDAEMYILGDTNDDKSVNIMDVTAIQRHLAGLESLEGGRLEAADTNQDGNLNINDATNLQKFIARYDINNPIGEVFVI